MNYKQEFENTMVDLLEKAWLEGKAEGIRRAESEYGHGYASGLKDGKASVQIDESTAYEAGLNDAWECARKIVLDTKDGGISDNALKGIVGDSSYNIIKHHPVSEVIEDIKKWEEKQKEYFPEGNSFISKQDDTERSCSTCADSDKECNDHNLHCDYSCWTPKQDDTEIRVDDEVIYNGEKGVVLNIVNHSARVMFSDRITYELYVDDLIKTGKHYDIESILKQMQEG